ncbi:MAG: hypothetical protein AAF125_23965, partial [Chloroflexota bacterium]
EARTRIRIGYLVDVLWIPLFFSSILVAVPVAWWARVVGVLLLFGTSYGYHYFQAAYQANEMLFFLHKALRPHLVHDVPELAPATGDTVTMDINQAFPQAWERFYQQHAPKDDR